MKLAHLLPRQDKFSHLLASLSKASYVSACYLKSYIEAMPDERPAIARNIQDCKANAKELLSSITQSLCQTYITPFDREDIQEFAVHLYKITKTIDKVRERISLHDLSLSDGNFARQVDLICLEGIAMNDMVEALNKGKASKMIMAKTDLLLDLESKGDELLAELLVDLFATETSARELILRKDIYDMLEKVIDRYRDAGNIAVEIVLKHS